MSASAITPIVFWASFVPCVNATKLPEKIWARRKTRFTRLGERRRITQMITSISPRAIAKPRIGESTPGLTTFSQTPLHWIDAPAVGRDRGAGDAADERVARARRQPQEPGDEVPGDRPDEPGEDDAQRHRVRVDDPRRDRRRDLERDERAGEVQDGRDEDCRARRERPRRDAGRDGVRRVVEAVREVEEERHRDDRDEREGLHASRLRRSSRRCSR